MIVTYFCLISLVSLLTMTLTLLFMPYEYDTENTRSENYDD
jgi:hypothetical protein